MPDHDTYRVYLREASPHPSVTSPVETDHIEYYDSGVWLDRAGGRVFLPYHQIQLIAEGDPGGEDAGTDIPVERSETRPEEYEELDESDIEDEEETEYIEVEADEDADLEASEAADERAGDEDGDA